MTSFREALATLPASIRTPPRSTRSRPSGPCGRRVPTTSSPSTSASPRGRDSGRPSPATTPHWPASRPGRPPSGSRPGGPWARCSAIEDEILLDGAADTFEEAQRRGHPVIAGMQDVVAGVAARHPIGLITNGPSDIQRLKLEQSGLTGAFGCEVISGELGVGKPDPSVFHGVLEGLAAEPSASVMVGDSWERDVLGGLHAGMSAVWIAGGRRGAGAPAGCGGRRLGARPARRPWTDSPDPSQRASRRSRGAQPAIWRSM